MKAWLAVPATWMSSGYRFLTQVHHDKGIGISGPVTGKGDQPDAGVVADTPGDHHPRLSGAADLLVVIVALHHFIVPIIVDAEGAARIGIAAHPDAGTLDGRPGNDGVDFGAVDVVADFVHEQDIHFCPTGAGDPGMQFGALVTQNVNAQTAPIAIPAPGVGVPAEAVGSNQPHPGDCFRVIRNGIGIAPLTEAVPVSRFSRRWGDVLPYRWLVTLWGAGS